MGTGCISTPAPANNHSVLCKIKTGHSSHEKSQQLHKKRRRKSVRKRFFQTEQTLLNPDCNTPTKSNATVSTPISEYNDSLHVPHLPIRFANDYEIWSKEYNLFIQNLSNLLPLHTTDKHTLIVIIEMFLEYGGIDVIYKYGNDLCINRGLWPQNYILEETQQLTAHGMVQPNIRDELIQSFNLGAIFDICGNCYASQCDMKRNRFMAYGVDIDIDDHIVSEYESNGGCTSTTSSIGYNTINPLKFKIYSHDIMVIDTGCYIERHNEYFCENDEAKKDDPDPTYFMTLILLPPNIQSYKGGTFRFHGVGTETNYIQVKADSYSWSWMLFDKRIEYECDAVLKGKCIAFKMDIDVWKKTLKETKQDEASCDTMNKLLIGELNLNYYMDDVYDDQSIVISSSEASPTPDVIFPPCNITTIVPL